MIRGKRIVTLFVMCFFLLLVFAMPVMGEETKIVIQYTVEEGDTLYSIASQYGITIEQLKRINRLDNNDDLEEGMILNITKVFVTPNVIPDVKGHWAEKQIESWIAKDLMKGYADGSFKPNNGITRAEFITLVNNSFGFKAKAVVKFSDVHATDWFAGEIAKAKAVGYIAGYNDGTIRPGNKISRQEIATILSKILKLDSAINETALPNFKDGATIPEWSKAKIGIIVAKGYMAGYTDQTFKPQRSATRAEVVALIFKAVGTLYNTPGSYGSAENHQVIEGNVTISSGDVTLKNTEIKGNLYLTEGIGDGNVTLDNVTVQGTTTVSGGGVNGV